MKLIKKITVSSLLFIIILFFICNIPMTTRQGINGVVTVKKIPLYAKLCGFLYRDHQTRDLSNSIIEGIAGDQERVMVIYEWTIKNIKRPPKGFRSVDDHIWDIIVRGYGAGDQMADVFTTLTSYAGYEAFWDKFEIENYRSRPVLSFVKIGEEWHVFDIYNKKYFIDGKDLTMPTIYGPTYGEYLETMDKGKFKSCIRRMDKQKILPRVIYELKKLLFPGAFLSSF